jgi:hypothetical protein
MKIGLPLFFPCWAVGHCRCRTTSAARRTRQPSRVEVHCNDRLIGHFIADTLATDLAKIKSLNVVERIALNQVFPNGLSEEGLVESLQAGTGQAMDQLCPDCSPRRSLRNLNSYSIHYNYNSKVSLNRS